MHFISSAWFIFILISVSSSIPTSSVAENHYEQPFNISQHEFVFISGWPQSGTSLLLQMFSLNTAAFSTHVPGCLQHLGVKCANYNNEGQWLLQRDSFWNSVYRPGMMCPAEQVLDQQIQGYIPRVLSQWKKFWNIDKQILVEKSPQSMLKIPLMEQVVQGAKAARFIVVLKHPATLNVATPKGYQWLTHDSPINKGPLQHIPNSYEEILSNVEHFLAFMDKNATYARNLNCDYGWLQALEYLESSGLNSYNVKIGIFCFLNCLKFPTAFL